MGGGGGGGVGGGGGGVLYSSTCGQQNATSVLKSQNLYISKNNSDQREKYSNASADKSKH